MELAKGASSSKPKVRAMGRCLVKRRRQYRFLQPLDSESEIEQMESCKAPLFANPDCSGISLQSPLEDGQGFVSPVGCVCRGYQGFQQHLVRTW